MLKRFFTVFLGSMAAIWLSVLLFVGMAIIAVMALVGRMGTESAKVSAGSILYLDLSGEITDRYTAPSISDVMMGDFSDNMSFNEIARALELAKNDSKISGVYMNLRGSSMGQAMREELNNALADFRKSGKWIIAYADNYSQGDFLTATAADELYINPSGQLSANGLAVTVPYFKNALDKLGVEIQVIKVGTFKSAVEPFIMTQMSDSARYQYEVMLGTMWDSYVSDVTDNLGLNKDFRSEFQTMSATPMTYFTASQLVEAKLFNDTKYAYEITNMLKKRTGEDNVNLISPRDYLVTFDNEIFKTVLDDKDHIAVLYAVGDIVDSGSDGIVGDRMSPLISSLAEDDHVKGLVLRVNSGGGSAFASEQIWAALEYFKAAGKPFVVSMGDVAASGGYYISCGAERIFADPSTITGSIGIFGIIPYARELLNDKLGIDFSVVQTNPNAVFPSLDRPLTPDQHAALEKSIHNGYDLFISRVAEGRHMTDTAVRRIAEGRVWAGATAREIGLVDELGGLAEAIAYISEKTKIPADQCTEYPAVKQSPLDLVLSVSDMKAVLENASLLNANTLGLTQEQLRDGAKTMRRIRNMNTIQAKMEDIRID